MFLLVSFVVFEQDVFPSSFLKKSTSIALTSMSCSDIFDFFHGCTHVTLSITRQQKQFSFQNTALKLSANILHKKRSENQTLIFPLGRNLRGFEDQADGRVSHQEAESGANFTNMLTCNFYLRRSFCAFVIFGHKSCLYNVGQINSRNQSNNQIKTHQLQKASTF